MNITYNMLDHGASKNNPCKIIVHSMGEYIDNGEAVYKARDWLHYLKLSTHALVHSNGNIEMCRPPNAGAYHARGHNTDSLGMEFLVPGVHDYSTFLETIKTDWCTPEQYEAGMEIINQWRFDYDIGLIVRHSDVSPGRKVDPGTGFKWREFSESLK